MNMRAAHVSLRRKCGDRRSFLLFAFATQFWCSRPNTTKFNRLQTKARQHSTNYHFSNDYITLAVKYMCDDGPLFYAYINILLHCVSTCEYWCARKKNATHVTVATQKVMAHFVLFSIHQLIKKINQIRRYQKCCFKYLSVAVCAASIVDIYFYYACTFFTYFPWPPSVNITDCNLWILA